MVYANNLQWVERSGLGLRIVDENVGTGDDSETDFDLDNDNVIGGSYVISYAASGSNTFTPLTETTHYTLDKESGRIVLTGTGVTAVSTNIIYATYWYTDIFNDSVVTDLLAVADEEVDKLTGQTWDGPTSFTEYIDGRKRSGYPTTDQPYAKDWDAPDTIVLKHFNVTAIDFVYFLNNPQQIGKFFNYDAGTAAYTDKTDNANSFTEAPFLLFDDAAAVNDYVYIGSSNVFMGLQTTLSTVGTGSPVIDWEYYNGSSWTDITETDVDSGASTFTASGTFTWVYPYGWAQTSVNSESKYWIRGKLTTGYTVDPACSVMSMKDSVSAIIEPYQFVFDSNGVLSFTGSRISSGTNNIRVDYKHGRTSTPGYITELTVLLASVKAYVNLSGGSYDDATSYTLGSKSVTIGEVYVNIREVISQFKSRIDEILNMVGKRAKVVAI